MCAERCFNLIRKDTFSAGLLKCIQKKKECEILNILPGNDRNRNVELVTFDIVNLRRTVSFRYRMVCVGAITS